MLSEIIKGHINANKAERGVLDPEKEDVAKARLTICRSCDTLDHENMKCDRSKGGCGCNMNKKAYSMGSKCPKGKW